MARHILAGFLRLLMAVSVLHAVKLLRIVTAYPKALPSDLPTGNRQSPTSLHRSQSQQPSQLAGQASTGMDIQTRANLLRFHTVISSRNRAAAKELYAELGTEMKSIIDAESAYTEHVLAPVQFKFMRALLLPPYDHTQAKDVLVEMANIMKRPQNIRKTSAMLAQTEKFRAGMLRLDKAFGRPASTWDNADYAEYTPKHIHPWPGTSHVWPGTREQAKLEAFHEAFGWLHHVASLLSKWHEFAQEAAEYTPDVFTTTAYENMKFLHWCSIAKARRDHWDKPLNSPAFLPSALMKYHYEYGQTHEDHFASWIRLRRENRITHGWAYIPEDVAKIWRSLGLEL